MTRPPAGRPDVPAGPRRLTRQILSDEVYDALKAMIMDHALAPRERINIDRLGREINVSQTPLREALARLESEGLVTKEALIGYSATPLLSQAEMEDLFELRMLIEPWSAERAAKRMTDETASRLGDELATIRRIPDGPSYETYKSVTAHDARFHDLVHEFGGNVAVRAAFERTHCHLHIFRLHYVGGSGHATIDEHRAVAAAITAGNPRAARDAMIEHLECSRDRLRRVYS